MTLSDVVEAPEEISHAIILLGITKPDSVAADVGFSNALNVDGIKSIVDQLEHWQITPVFASTESVFDGLKGNYVETDPANPILTYGRQKVEIESYLQETCDEFIVLRLARVLGSQRGDGTLFDEWLDAIERRERIYCAYDQVSSPIYIEDVVTAIISLMDNGYSGIFHLSNHQSFSRLELLEMLVAGLAERPSVRPEIVPCSIRDLDLRENRPLDISMRPDKLVAAIDLPITAVERVCLDVLRNSAR